VRVAVDVDDTVNNKEAASSLFKLGLVGYRRGDTILTAPCHSCVSTSTYHPNFARGVRPNCSVYHEFNVTADMTRVAAITMGSVI